jgi:peptidyl-tRNA hydrolase
MPMRTRAGGEPTWDPEHVADWVLAPPGPSDRAALEDAAERAADAIESMLHEGVEAAMQRFNTDPKPGKGDGQGTNHSATASRLNKD